jgi:hypothetical protein
LSLKQKACLAAKCSAKRGTTQRKKWRSQYLYLNIHTATAKEDAQTHISKYTLIKNVSPFPSQTNQT